MKGNGFTASTYRYAQKPIYRLPAVSNAWCTWPVANDVEQRRIDEEPDFLAAYRKELYHTPNIEVVGWLDLNSEKFHEVMRSCIGTVFCSCSEGCSGTVIDTMHAGLISIVNYESGVDFDGFAVPLKQSTVEEIKEAVRMVSDMPAGELVRRMEQTRAYGPDQLHTKKLCGSV